MKRPDEEIFAEIQELIASMKLKAEALREPGEILEGMRTGDKKAAYHTIIETCADLIADLDMLQRLAMECMDVIREDGSIDFKRMEMCLGMAKARDRQNRKQKGREQLSLFGCVPQGRK